MKKIFIYILMPIVLALLIYLVYNPIFIKANILVTIILLFIVDCVKYMFYNNNYNYGKNSFEKIIISSLLFLSIFSILIIIFDKSNDYILNIINYGYYIVAFWLMMILINRDYLISLKKDKIIILNDYIKVKRIKYSNIDKIVIEDDIMIVHIDSSVPLKLNIFLSNIQKQMFVLYLEQFKVNVECKK